MRPINRVGTISALIVAAAASIASASAQDTRFEQLVYLTCTDAQAMPPQERIAAAELLAEHSARHHGVPWPLPAELSDDAGMLVRGICTMYPEGNLFSIINRVIETTFAGGS